MTHFTYRRSEPSAELEQGDVLTRSGDLIAVLDKYHPYYVQKVENEHFVVLTQSCDLVRSRSKTRYITIAPARPLKAIINQQFGPDILVPVGTRKPIGTSDVQERLRQFLIRLHQNNHTDWFFLQQAPEFGLADDMCVVIGLAISLKFEHYDTCFAARLLQLDQVFQAKLGWVLGQQFARVATEDWEEEALQLKVQSVLNQTAVWMPKRTRTKVVELLQQEVERDAAFEADEIVLSELAGTVRSQKDEAIDAVVAALARIGVDQHVDAERLRKTVQTTLSKYIKA